MAAVGVTISGILYDKKNKTSQNVALIGAISLTGVGVGGGPIIPGGPGKPPDIGDAHPEHPIVIPPTIWPDPPVKPQPPSDAHPEHPIVIPPPEGVDGPAFDVHTVWTERTGWVIILTPNFEHAAPSTVRK